MARNFPAVEPQQLFEQPTQYQPKANQLQAVEDTFLQTIGNRLESDYGKLADQYENKQISDQDFSTGVELLVNRVQQPTLKDKWTPVVGQAKYMVFSNAQALTDSKIQTDLNTGALSPTQAIQRYNEMASAALKFNTQTSIQDAAAWSLKASAIQAAIRKSSSGPGREQKNYDDLKRKYELAQFSLDQDQQVLNDNLAKLGSAVSNGEITADEANALRRDTINEFYDSVSSFGYNGDVLDFISEVDPGSGYNYLNEKIDFTRSLGAPMPGYYSGYQSGLDALDAYQAAQQEEYVSEQPNISDVLQGLTEGTNYGPRIQAESTPTPGPAVPLVKPQTQYQSNPLGLGTGAPV